MSGRISVVVPMFNEKERLPSTLDEMSVFHRNNPGVIDEVILVDDGSKDGTVEWAMRWRLKIPLVFVVLPENRGKWFAIHEGLKLAQNDAVLLLDADGSASVNELGKIDLDSVLKKKIGVFGSRFMGRVEGKSFLRGVVSRGYSVYAHTLYYFFISWAENAVDDFQCPWKLIFKSKIAGRLVEDRFAGDFELIKKYDGEIWNVGVDFVHKRGSKVPLSAMWQMAWRTWEIARE